METYSIRNLTFTYPGGQRPALDGINLSLKQGELIVLCGKSGCGKTTLLRNLKTVLTPFGERTGEILFDGRALESVEQREQAGRIGYVLQNPDSQLVTDKVWHELAFGLENLGVDTKTIRVRVAEMASFFGIQTWFDKNVTQLSGGQKQILNLAAVMVMQPDVLVLDEPTSQLDPIAAGEFLETVRKVNREIGTTVVMTEHRLDEILPMANRAIVMDHGKIIVDDIPANAGAVLAQTAHHMFEGMPAPLQAYAMVYGKGHGQNLPCPVDVGEGRAWLSGLFENHTPAISEIPATTEPDHQGETPVVELTDVWYRYARDDKDVVKGLSLKAYPGEIFCIVGGNGTGKTTALSLISGLRKPIRGKVSIRLNHSKQTVQKNSNLRGEGMIGVLPQNAQAIFVENTIKADLMEVQSDKTMSIAEREAKLAQVAELVEIDHLLNAHPYDVSGGEQQRAALAKILLLNPKIILLDEPTKGIDNHFKNKLAEILRKCAQNGATVIMVSHDIEFCGKYADRCAMFFDGAISTTNAPRKFFSGNSFYTTASNRMSRHLFGNAITPKDVAELCIANLEPTEGGSGPSATTGKSIAAPTGGEATPTVAKAGQKPPQGSLATMAMNKKFRWTVNGLILLLMPLTIYLGTRMSGESGYLISSLLMIFYLMVPFFLSFERRKPQAREVVLIAVMIALAVASRAAFFMVPQFKPMLAIIIIAGVCLGAQSGFLVGSLSAFVSNFLFGQGPWTPFQMLAWGLIGFFAGLLAANLLKSKNPVALSIYGFFAVFLLHGGITDLWTLLGMSAKPTLAMVMTVYGTGMIFNIILAAATVLFLLLLTKPMTEKIQRVQRKYGLLARQG